MSDLDRLARLLGTSGDPNNPSPRDLRSLISRLRTLAVVGASRDPLKPARRVPSYLAAKGMEIIPVNPNASWILGRRARSSLAEVTEDVDLVLVFRPSNEAGALIDQATTRPEAPAVWLQEGIRHDETAERARARGITVVQDLCLFSAHRCLRANRPDPIVPPGPDQTVSTTRSA